MLIHELRRPLARPSTLGSLLRLEWKLGLWFWRSKH